MFRAKRGSTEVPLLLEHSQFSGHTRSEDCRARRRPRLHPRRDMKASFSRAIYYSCSSIPQPHAAEALTRWPSRPSGTDKASNPLSSPASFAVSSRDAMIWINPPALLHACAGMLHRIYFGLIILRRNLVLGWATYDCCNVYIWELPYFEVRCASAGCHYPT